MRREFLSAADTCRRKEFYYQANVKLGIGKEFTFDKYIKSAKTRIAKEFNERYKELQERVKNEKGFKDILAKHSQDATPIAGMLKVIRKYGNNQDINLAALFEEINDPSSTILAEVFRDSRLAPLKQDFKEEILELSNADEETSDSNEEDTTTQANDDIDNYINSLNQKLGDYASFIQHVDGFIRSYFNGLKKLDSTNLTTIQYDKSNPLGVSDTMNNDECCLALFTYGDFTSVDKMIASIKLIANNLDGFRAFAQFAEDLSKDRDFANYIYTNFIFDICNNWSIEYFFKKDNCMSCCTNILDLGCVGACEAIELPIIPTVEETWTIEIELFGIILTKEYVTTIGQPIIINISEYELNENTCIKFKVKDENGDTVEYVDIDDTYDCFKFKTIIKR